MAFTGERRLDIGFHPGQIAMYNSLARFIICAAGRRFGKSYFAAAKLSIEGLKSQNERGYKLTNEHGVYYIGPTFDQAKRIMWRRLINFLRYESAGGFIRNENKNDGFVELINGRRIYIKGADNEESLRGEGYSYVVLDEYADMKAHVWDEIIDPALMDVEGGALFIGTPKGKNHFYRLFTEAMNGRPDWEAFHFKSEDNPYLKKSEIDRIRNDPNKSIDVIRQELEASFVSGGPKVLRPEWFGIIEACDPSQGSLFVTCDLAGFKKEEGNKVLRSDESVICVTLVNESQWIVLQMQHGYWDPRETALRIITTLRDFPGARLGIEQGMSREAVRPYLEDYMREFSRFVNIEELRHQNQKKADRITWALQGRAERRQISLLRRPTLPGAKPVNNDWIERLQGQLSDFPSPLSKDDLIDALSYVDQMATASYVSNEDLAATEWEALDPDSGY